MSHENSEEGWAIKINIDMQPAELFGQIHDLARMAFPGYDFLHRQQEGVSNLIRIEVTRQGKCLSCKGLVDVEASTTRDAAEYQLPPEPFGGNSAERNAIRRFTFGLLSRYWGGDLSPYGCLTGVRPVKIVHRLLDQGYDDGEILGHLHENYLIDLDKARLLLEVAHADRPFLLNQQGAGALLSIYIGIPFCPTRCYYCSFPGSRVVNYDLDVTPFMKSLLVEMEMIGAAITENGWKIQTVYLGGGTPTVLSQAHMEDIFAVLHDKFISDNTSEITVEAGRPDSITKPGLIRLQEMGVNRICINPQTMDDETLRFIGRRHDSRMVVAAVEWVRQAGIKNLNMDLIVGLPGENMRHYQNTARRILELEPDNITVHTLASKRGSVMFQTESRSNAGNRGEQAAQGIALMDGLYREANFRPYYLYRQKNMQANLENTGYQRSDSPCIYNIQMIEERQTIIGMGGGASSKFVRPGDWSLTSFQNPKEVKRYVEAAPRLIAGKVDKLQALN